MSKELTEHERMVITKYDLLYESRITKVETSLENINNNMQNIKEDFKEIKSDFRWMFALMITITGVLLSVMAKGFGWY